MEPGMIGLGWMGTSLVRRAAPHDRFRRRGEADFADKLLSAMRPWFGGHAEKTTTAKGDVS